MDTALANNASSSDSLPRPQVNSTLPAGDVEVSVMVPVSADVAWAALTERETVARWFGDLSGSLRTGGSYRLDFGDGDFFDISEVRLRPPHDLSYQWRFLGTSPACQIGWHIAPETDRCRVTVTDRQEFRSKAGAAELSDGWYDFLQRLQGYCATGQTTRYAWRREFDASIELPLSPAAAFEQLLSSDGRWHWMPFSAESISSGSPATLDDGSRPARFVIESVKRSARKGMLRFSLSSPEWVSPTQCVLRVEKTGNGALLVVSHSGWEAISANAEAQGEQRKRFGSLWIRSLGDAQRSVGKQQLVQ
jgi:uncharacterized protein YndB with AHSA1/START domain